MTVTISHTNQMIDDAVARQSIERLKAAWDECQRLQREAEVYRRIAEFRRRCMRDAALRARVASLWRIPC